MEVTDEVFVTALLIKISVDENKNGPRRVVNQTREQELFPSKFYSLTFAS